MPWIIVCVILLLWGTNYIKAILNAYATWNYAVPGLHNMINKVAPMVPVPTKEAAVFSFTWLSYTGSGMLISAIISGLLMGFSPVELVVEYGKTIKVCAYSLLTISAMLAIGTLTRLSGVDATLGLAFTKTGFLYPFFGTLLGWLGVALTGSDTSSNSSSAACRRSRPRGRSSGLADPDGDRQQHRRRDGQDDRRAKHRGRLDRDQPSDTRADPALRLPTHPGAGRVLVGMLVMLQAYVFTGMIVSLKNPPLGKFSATLTLHRKMQGFFSCVGL